MTDIIGRTRDLVAEQLEERTGTVNRSMPRSVERAQQIVDAVLRPSTPFGASPLPKAHVPLLYMQLGDMQYEVAGPVTGLEAQSAVRFAEHAVIDGKPRLQRIGEELEIITLTCDLHSGYCDAAHELARLTTARSAGDALPLVFANGHVRGRFVIVALEETHNKHTALGDLVSARVRVTLKEWVEDQTIEIASRKKRTAAAAIAPAQRATATRPTPNMPIGDPHDVSISTIVRD